MMPASAGEGSSGIGDRPGERGAPVMEDRLAV
jgi:hypothetical protein